MTYEELKVVIQNNTEASWQENNIVEALESYVDRIVERLERRAYETADWMCGGTMKAVELTDAIAVVKGVQNE